MTRDLRDYTIALICTAREPIVHGGNTPGSFRTVDGAYYDPEEGEWVDVRVPEVSAAAMRSALREMAVQDFRRMLGYPYISADKLRFLVKGTTDALPLHEARRLSEMIPIVAIWGVFGTPGRLEVTGLRPYTDETVEAGYVPRDLRPTSVTVDGEVVEGDAIPLWEIEHMGERLALPPMPADMVMTTINNYRHDITLSRIAEALPGEERRAIEDKKAARKESGSKASKDKVSESMPYSREAIRQGTPLFCRIDLKAASEIEIATLMRAIMLWRQDGAHVGGSRREHYGSLDVQVRGWRSLPSRGSEMAAGTEIATTDTDPLTAQLRAHISEHYDELVKWLAE